MTPATPARRSETGAVAAGLRSTLRLVYRAVARSPAAPFLRSPVIERARRRVTATGVEPADVIDILELLRASGVETWLAGGWACDALLGEQTRPHADLDLVIAERDRRPACEALARDGFALTEVYEAGLMRTAIELLDRRGRRKVAMHLVDFLSDRVDSWTASLRRTMQELQLGTQEVFATGTIAGRSLPCVSAPALVALHTGYEPRPEDRRDVCLLCARFSLRVPPGYDCPGDAA